MSCQRCKADRVMRVSAKCSDLCAWVPPEGGDWRDGYVPRECGIGGGDYVRLAVCLACGQMQGAWPQPGPSDEDVS